MQRHRIASHGSPSELTPASMCRVRTISAVSAIVFVPPFQRALLVHPMRASVYASHALVLDPSWAYHCYRTSTFLEVAHQKQLPVPLHHVGSSVCFWLYEASLCVAALWFWVLASTPMHRKARRHPSLVHASLRAVDSRTTARSGHGTASHRWVSTKHCQVPRGCHRR